MADDKALTLHLSEEVARGLEERAKKGGRSAEEEARAILEEVLRTDRSRFWDTVDSIRLANKSRTYLESADQIREARDK